MKIKRFLSDNKALQILAFEKSAVDIIIELIAKNAKASLSILLFCYTFARNYWLWNSKTILICC